MPNRILFPNSEQFDLMNENLKAIAAAVGSQVDLTTFAGIRKAVLSGIAKDVLPVGTLLTVNHSVYGNKPWAVLGHDMHKNAHNPDGHTMTIAPVPVLGTLQYDAPEAFYYATEALPAGTYNFTLATAYSSWAAGTYQFTTTQVLPVGGQFTVSGYADAAMTTRKVHAYSSRTNTTKTEECVITSGNGGTNLGTFGVELNHSQRVSYGSNNTKESAMRQFLNSSAVAGSVWTPQTKFDRPPSWMTSTAGFLNGMDSDLLEVVCDTIVPCCANSVYEAPDSTVTVGSRYTVNDKFFLLSNREIGFTSDVDDGSTLLPYYEGATNADRIKLNSSSVAARWWLRTPYSGHAGGVRTVNTDGSLSYFSAFNSFGFAPACTIG